MDNRAAKLANARKKLRDHQEKKSVYAQRDDISESLSSCGTPTNNNLTDQPTVANDEDNIIQTDNSEIVMEQGNFQESNHDVPLFNEHNSFANVTEILISNKTNLETQNKELQEKIWQLENILSKEVDEHNSNKKKIFSLEYELNEDRKKYAASIESISSQDKLIIELRNQVKSLTDENNNLTEQQEFTKSMLTTKEMEIAHLQAQVSALQNHVDAATLQLQQLSSDTSIKLNQESSNHKQIDLLKAKIASLEHQLECSLKDKDQLNSHYEHYLNKLNDQLQAQTTKNESLRMELKGLYNRESSLIEQISLMEVRMQNFKKQSLSYTESHNNTIIEELKEKITALQSELDELNNKYNDLQKQNEEYVNTIQEQQTKIQEFSHENISITKLSADIASDKVAAQRATEQNKKLKTDVEELEQIVVKLGKDKLELTEKLSHEKQLNKQLMLKVADIDETSKQLQTKLMAKDEEMIRLQANYRDIENKHEALLENLLQSKENSVSINSCNVEVGVELKGNGVEEDENNILAKSYDCSGDCHAGTHKMTNSNNGNVILKEDAMSKLHDRFLNIMDQVANLSDEKHRLEHIILQLQTETDTICEYVALYQQQRSLLKKRDEERSAQIKLFQMECDAVKRQLEELSGLFLKLAQDQDLSPHLQVESRHSDIAKIKKLLDNLRNSSLINSKCMNLEFSSNFYPCNCCSGQLIDV